MRCSSARQWARSWGRRGAGLACLLGVVVIWVVSGELIEFIFTQQTFQSPFFVTYFNTSLFTVYLLGFLVRPAWWGENGPPTWMVWMRWCRSAGVVEPPPPKHESEDVDEASPSLQSGAAPPPVVMWTVRQVAWVALGFCPLWFGANYLYNLALSMTSVASATILSTTSSLFTFGLSCLMRVEQPTVWKLAGLLTMLGGVVLVSLVDTGSGGSSGSIQRDSLLGDALAIGGAIVYAGYAVYLKVKLDEHAVHMPMFFGLVGLINMALLWPVGLLLHVTGLEPLHAMSGSLVGFLFANAIIGTVISDYLWVLAVLLVSPVVATAGLSLTIPLSMIADTLLHAQAFHALYVLGAVLTVVGFLLVNVNPLDLLRPLWQRCRRNESAAV